MLRLEGETWRQVSECQPPPVFHILPNAHPGVLRNEFETRIFSLAFFS